MSYIEMKLLSSGRQVNASRSSESFSVGGPFCFSCRRGGEGRGGEGRGREGGEGREGRGGEGRKGREGEEKDNEFVWSLV